MPSVPVHRFHNVPEESQWRGLFAAWRAHLQAVWDHDNDDVPWGYSERTNVGLLASANDKDGGVSLVELPFKRRAGEADEGVGRFDVWLARNTWQVYAEAKQAWAPGYSDERIEHAVDQMDSGWAQSRDLRPLATGATVATLVFVVPYPSWISTTTPEGVRAEFQEFEMKLWNRHDRRSKTFQTSFLLPAAQIRAIESERHVRDRAFPGVILCGRIHKARVP